MEVIELRVSEVMEFGSDDEKALTKAIDHSFPGSQRILCTRHLKDNLSRYMSDKAGIRRSERVRISQRVFGDKGLVNANDTYEFEESCVEILSMTSNEIFLNYFTTSFKPRILEFVTKPRQEGGKKGKEKGPLWTNNNAESMNNVLKQAVDFKPQRTPDLIEKIYEVVNLQILDLKRSLHEKGNFQLSRDYTNYTIPDMTWNQKNEEQRNNAFEKFLNDVKNRPKPASILSSDGNLSLPCRAQKLAIKPGQKKGAKSERTKRK